MGYYPCPQEILNNRYPAYSFEKVANLLGIDLEELMHELRTYQNGNPVTDIHHHLELAQSAGFGYAPLSEDCIALWLDTQKISIAGIDTLATAYEDITTQAKQVVEEIEKLNLDAWEQIYLSR